MKENGNRLLNKIIGIIFIGFVLISLWCMFRVAHMADNVVYVEDEKDD